MFKLGWKSNDSIFNDFTARGSGQSKMTEIIIPINLDLRKRGIKLTSLIKDAISKIVYINIEYSSDAVFFANYDNFDDFIKGFEDQLLNNGLYISADNIEVLSSFLIDNRKAVQDTVRELKR